MDVKTEEVTIEDMKIESEQDDVEEDYAPEIEERDGAAISSEPVDPNNVRNWMKTEYTEDIDIKEFGARVYDEHPVSSTDAVAAERCIKVELAHFEEVYVKQEICDDKEVASPEVAEDESDMGEVDSGLEITCQSPILRIRKAVASTTVHDLLTVELPVTYPIRKQNPLQNRKAKKLKTCDTCGRSFRTRSGLKKHVGTHMNPYRCILCNKALTTQRSIESHIKWHTTERLFKCDVCKSSFVSRQSLVHHVKIHNKPIKCSKCNKTFLKETNFAVHWGLHMGEKPYPCDMCSEGFSTHADLLTHLKCHPVKRIEEPAECATCGKLFLTLSKLTTHMRLHTGERPYPCHTCGQRFTDHWILSNHLMTHGQSKPFVCITCGVRFSQSSELKCHLTVHTMEEQLRCKVCGEAVGIGNVALHLNCRTLGF